MIDIFITIIDLLLKKKIGEEKAIKLIKILKRRNDNMLAVLNMIRKKVRKKEKERQQKQC